MIYWLLRHQPSVIRASRWIVAGCAFALLGLASLPHNPLDRIVAVAGIVIIAAIFLIWLTLVLLTVFHPRLIQKLRHQRAATADSESPTAR
jgi:hypothetical protein